MKWLCQALQVVLKWWRKHPSSENVHDDDDQLHSSKQQPLLPKKLSDPKQPLEKDEDRTHTTVGTQSDEDCSEASEQATHYSYPFAIQDEPAATAEKSRVNSTWNETEIHHCRPVSSVSYERTSFSDYDATAGGSLASSLSNRAVCGGCHRCRANCRRGRLIKVYRDAVLSMKDEVDLELHAAVKYGDIEELKHLLDMKEFKDDMKLNELDSCGRTALDLAALTGQLDMMRMIEGCGGLYFHRNKQRMEKKASKRACYVSQYHKLIAAELHGN